MLRLLGHGHGDLLGPICEDDGPATAARALRAALATTRHDVFVADWVAGDRHWARALGGRVLRTTGYPILEPADRSQDGLLAEASVRLRKTIRHC